MRRVLAEEDERADEQEDLREGQTKTKRHLAAGGHLETRDNSLLAADFDDVRVELFVDGLELEPLPDVHAGRREHEVDDDRYREEERNTADRHIDCFVRPNLLE